MSRVIRRLYSHIPANQYRNSFRLKGIYPSVVTPFRSWEDANHKGELEVDFARFEQMLIHLRRFPLSGFALLGTAGECGALSHDNKMDLIQHARKQLGEVTTIITGAGLDSSADTIDLVNEMAKAGSDASFVFCPKFFKQAHDKTAYLDFFTKIADRSLVPIVLYNIPYQREFDIPVDVVLELSKHPNICGLFDTSGDMARVAAICQKNEIKDKYKKHFDVLAVSASYLLPTLISGGQGGVGFLANILPFEMYNLVELYNEGKLDRARHLQWRLMEPNDAITKKYGVAGLKAALGAAIDMEAGLVKAPLRKLSKEEMADCLDAFYRNGFLQYAKEAAEREKEEAAKEAVAEKEASQ